MGIKEIVMIDSDEAAKRVTVEGWVSRDGLFYGDNEHAAKLAGCTHKYCDNCGVVISKHGLTICPSCREKKAIEKYNAMPSVEWDCETPLYSDTTDEYFSDEDMLLDYLEEHECSVDSLRLIICEPNKFREIESDYFYDDLPEDGHLPTDLEDALNALNKVIRSQPPASWSPGKYAAKVKQ